MSKLISKTVRLPAELVERIDRMPGSNFTQRLIRLVDFYESDYSASTSLRFKVNTLQARIEAYEHALFNTLYDLEYDLHDFAKVDTIAGSLVPEDPASDDNAEI